MNQGLSNTHPDFVNVSWEAKPPTAENHSSTRPEEDDSSLPVGKRSEKGNQEVGTNRKVPSSCLGVFTLWHIQSRVGQCRHVAPGRLSAAVVKFSGPEAVQGGRGSWVGAVALLPCELAPLESP